MSDDRPERIARLISGPAGAVVVAVACIAAFGWFVDRRVVVSMDLNRKVLEVCRATHEIVRIQMHRNVDTPEQP